MDNTRPQTWVIATDAQCRADAETLIYGAPLPSRRARIDALVDADVAASVAAAAEARTDRAIAVGLPGIVRGDHVTYLDGDAIRRGTFERVAVYGYGTGSRFRFDHYEVVVATTDGGAVSVDPALVERADAPALPACAGFVGTGRRCGTCRIHRNIHN